MILVSHRFFPTKFYSSKEKNRYLVYPPNKFGQLQAESNGSNCVCLKPSSMFTFEIVVNILEHDILKSNLALILNGCET